MGHVTGVDSIFFLKSKKKKIHIYFDYVYLIFWKVKVYNLRKWFVPVMWQTMFEWNGSKTWKHMINDFALILI